VTSRQPITVGELDDPFGVQDKPAAYSPS
jgi:hypothetical protein